MWRERPGGPFAVDQQSLLLPVDHVLLHFGDIVRNVVDDVHVQVVRRAAEHFGEGLKNKVRQNPLAVRMNQTGGELQPRGVPTCLVRKVMDERLTQA